MLSDPGTQHPAAAVIAQMGSSRIAFQDSGIRSVTNFAHERMLQPVPLRIRRWLRDKWRDVQEGASEETSLIAPPPPPPEFYADLIIDPRDEAQTLLQRFTLLLNVLKLTWRLVGYYWRMQKGLVQTYFTGGWSSHFSSVKTVVWRKLLTQLLQLASGVHTRVGVEYHDSRPRYGSGARPERHGVRIPLEMHWSSDWIRAWLYVDLWNEAKRNRMIREHTLTFGVAFLDSFTLFEHSLSLNSLYAMFAKREPLATAAQAPDFAVPGHKAALRQEAEDEIVCGHSLVDIR
eukprot:TRINITY_DN902_c0_g1_i1.p1 TRINITY_DN902_c0_g1~~TRINITY_DN902_c0_g1_i1.p1  ORF type:complete len:289 (-),score=40.82 TRINITY_DN902_c0_g1_i1:835-1701(-)